MASWQRVLRPLVGPSPAGDPRLWPLASSTLPLDDQRDLPDEAAHCAISIPQATTAQRRRRDGIRAIRRLYDHDNLVLNIFQLIHPRGDFAVAARTPGALGLSDAHTDAGYRTGANSRTMAGDGQAPALPRPLRSADGRRPSRFDTNVGGA